MNRLRILVCALLAALTPLVAAAQSDLGSLLQPGPLAARITFEGLVLDDAELSPGGASSGEERAELTLLLPVKQGANGEWALVLDAEHAALDRVPAGVANPDDLWGVRVGALHRRPLARGRTLFALGSVGSASDEPFASFDEVEIQGLAGLQIPRGPRSAWLVMAFFSNNRQFLNWIPLPAAGLLLYPSRNLTAAIGLPFAWIRARVHPDWELDASYFPIVNLTAGATWSASERLRLRAAFEWDAETFLPSERDDQDLQLYLEERRLVVSGRLELEGWDLELGAGQAIGRRRFISESYSGEERFARLDLDDAPFLRLRVRRTF